MRYRILIAVYALLSLPLISEPLLAVDLRTSVGDREVVRTVALQEEVVMSAPGDAAIVSPGEWIEADGAAQTCIACGKAGCGMQCLGSCGWWANFEYLLWWRRGSSFPPLVTTSPVGTARGVAGVLGQNTTTILLGDDDIGEEARPGGRVALGLWLDSSQTSGLEGRYWMLGEQTSLFAADSGDFPILARPTTVAGVNAANLLAFPGFTGPGNMSVTSQSQVLGGDALYRWCSAEIATARLDLMAGFQFSRIDEDLTVTSFTTSLVNPPGIGTTFDQLDTFRTRNLFRGGEIGMAVDWANCNWRVNLLGKIGFGNMREEVAIAGSTTITTPLPPPQTVSVIPGQLGGTANSGNFAQNEFAVVPELGIKFVCAVNECLDVSVGYNYIYWSHVLQAGNQIDPELDDPPSAFAFRSSSYWVHGLSFGGEYRF